MVGPSRRRILQAMTLVVKSIETPGQIESSKSILGYYGKKSGYYFTHAGPFPDPSEACKLYKLEDRG